MQFEMCALPGGGKLELYLRSPDPAMPNALRRPLVLVVPGGGQAEDQDVVRSDMVH